MMLLLLVIQSVALGVICAYIWNCYFGDGSW